MLSDIPIDLEKVSLDDMDNEILRVGILAEMDAVNLYEQMAARAEKDSVRKILLDIAREEKTHIGEFEALLVDHDEEQKQEIIAGRKEVEEKVSAPAGTNYFLIGSCIFLAALAFFSLKK
jgi:rubrerythrin